MKFLLEINRLLPRKNSQRQNYILRREGCGKIYKPIFDEGRKYMASADNLYFLCGSYIGLKKQQRTYFYCNSNPLLSLQISTRSLKALLKDVQKEIGQMTKLQVSN